MIGSYCTCRQALTKKYQRKLPPQLKKNLVNSGDAVYHKLSSLSHSLFFLCYMSEVHISDSFLLIFYSLLHLHHSIAVMICQLSLINYCTSSVISINLWLINRCTSNKGNNLLLYCLSIGSMQSKIVQFQWAKKLVKGYELIWKWRREGEIEE